MKSAPIPIVAVITPALFASGLASILQIKTWGPVGSSLLSIQGTSFNFVTPLLMGSLALKNGGADVSTMMAGLFGTLMVVSCTEILLSWVLYLARRIITPLVSGIVVMIIGISLIQVGLTSICGGFAALNDHTFGASKNLVLAGVVLLVIILLNCQHSPYLRVAGDRYGGGLSAGLGDRDAVAAVLQAGLRLKFAYSADNGVYGHLDRDHWRYHRHVGWVGTAGVWPPQHAAPERRRVGQRSELHAVGGVQYFS